MKQNTIIKKKCIAPDVWYITFYHELIAQKRKAGQFIIVRPADTSERIPLTIVDSDPAVGTVDIIVQSVGQTTRELCDLPVSERIHDVMGPLGKPTEIEYFGNCLCIAGGIGAAPLYPIITALRDKGNTVDAIIGARTESLLILTEEIGHKADNLYISTDDGSAHMKGLVTDIAGMLLKNGNRYDKAVVVGPPLMMRFTSDLTIRAGIPTVVSLNPIMVDGTGMCGGCRVLINGKTFFACVDGPEFDADGIDWDIFVQRLNAYRGFEEEKNHNHSCKLNS